MTLVDSTDAGPQVIPLWPGGAPGSEDWTQQEQVSVMPQGGLKVIRNVSQPTLTAYLPNPQIATGTAVIVCPGGAFHFLAYEHEGTQVAAWLTAHGIAAFILKYRLIPTTDNFAAEVEERLSNRDKMAGPMRCVGAADPGGRPTGGAAGAAARRGMAHRARSHRRHGLLRGRRGHDGGHARSRCEQPA